MTSEQAAALIEQNNRILAFYDQFGPLFHSFLHDVFPFLAVLAAAYLGHVFGKVAS